MRKAVKVLAVIVVLLLAGLLAAWYYIDAIAKTAIERGGTYALGVETTVDTVRLGLVGGTCRIDGLTVANPEGFKTPHLVRTGRFDLEVRPGSLLEDTIEVSRFVLDGLDLNIEQKLGAGSNVSVVLERVKTPGGADAKAEPAEGGKKVRVDRVVIRNVVAHVQVLPVGGQATTLDVKVPELILEDVSSDNAQGVAVDELMRRLLPAILAAVVDKGKGIVPDADLETLRGQVADTTRALGQGAARLAEQADQGIRKALGDLFRKPGEAADEAPKPEGDEAKPEGEAPKPSLLDLFKKK